MLLDIPTTLRETDKEAIVFYDITTKAGNITIEIENVSFRHYPQFVSNRS